MVGEYPFRYLSCTRAPQPFIHDIAYLPEIPSDLPCLEEIGIEHGVGEILKRLREEETHVLPVHAEAEGGVWSGYFIELLQGALSLHVSFLTLSEIRGRLDEETLPVRRFQMRLLPGRSAPCAV